MCGRIIGITAADIGMNAREPDFLDAADLRTIVAQIILA